MPFNWFLLTKVYNVWAKKVQKSYLSWHCRVIKKFKEKLTCGLENHMGNLANFHQEHSKISELGLWWDPFIQSKKFMSLRFTEELCIMAMKNDVNLLREIDLLFQNWHEEIDKFWPEYSKVSKICTLIGSFRPKYIMF